MSGILHHPFPLVSLSALLLIGCCGGENVPLGEVSGTVTLDGQPLPSGIVHFVPASGPAASGVIENGAYRLSTFASGDGAVLGSHTVYFAPARDEAHMQSYTEADYAAGKPPPEAPQEEFLPARYLTPSSSGLNVRVEAKANVHDFPLVSPAME